MWNLVGLCVMVGVLLVARWALRVWDSTYPPQCSVDPPSTAHVYEPVASTMSPRPLGYIPAPSVNLPDGGPEDPVRGRAAP